jgi:hypothetical protein
MSYAPACGRPWRMKRMLSWEGQRNLADFLKSRPNR